MLNQKCMHIKDSAVVSNVGLYRDVRDSGGPSRGATTRKYAEKNIFIREMKAKGTKLMV